MDIVPHEGSVVLSNNAEGIPLSIARMFGHEVYYSIDCVGTPYRSTRPANHLDTVNNGDRIIVDRVIGTAQHELRNLTSSNLPEKFLSGEATEISHGCKVVIGQPSGNVHSRNTPQSLYRVEITVQSNVFGPDYVNGSGVSPILLIESQNTLNRNLRQIADIQIDKSEKISLFERGKAACSVIFGVERLRKTWRNKCK